MSTSTILPARARAQLTAVDIHIARGGAPVLRGAGLTVTPGSRWGIVGENGRGKSTLLAVLAGTLEPDSGTVRRAGTLGLAEQELHATGDATVGDVIDAELRDARAALAALDAAAEALSRDEPGAAGAYDHALTAAEALEAWDADHRVDAALAALGAERDRARPLAELSVGGRYRVRLACLLGAEHDFLLLDEPTNHLDDEGLAYLTSRLSTTRSGVVLVSHDRALLAAVVTSVVDLDPTRDDLPRVYGDGYAGYLAGRAAERERWAEEYDRQRAETARLTANLADARDRLVDNWRPDKGTDKHKRATRASSQVRTFHRRQDELAAHAVTMPAPPLRLSLPELPRNAALTLDGVTVAGRLETPVTLTVGPSGRLHVDGRNGAGKSTLLAVLAGRLRPTTGTRRAGKNQRIGFLAQESPEPGVTTARRLFAAAGGSVELESLGLLDRGELDRPVRELSTGRRRRLDLALVLARRPHLLLLDEPTNHLSIALVDELTAALGGTNAAVVLATHDRALRADVAGWPRLDME
ncbi:macrolide transport system ATP-binding/permease protein [Catenuloplanes nepalensis]|uniref:Macrolide transport system ATP-binding/permease protein n=1 Tax=Catenuloplanes nepalensis TaxID=587533 RepID=A0ABT9N1R7_9ACTN|nr:ATP-binding cassette domain-containing protein [Catenuloplanes nepalensis]MDP9797638.1 macrolide transport system ATP-binding/permease protein [Catenuloplanes nepalensis]